MYKIGDIVTLRKSTPLYNSLNNVYKLNHRFRGKITRVFVIGGEGVLISWEGVYGEFYHQPTGIDYYIPPNINPEDYV